MIKVCHITSIHEVLDDRIFQRACKGLVNKGYDVTLICTHTQNEVIDGVKIVALKPRKGIKRKIISSHEAYKKALKVDADIFHFHDPDLFPWMIALQMQGRKVVYDIHENYTVRFKNPLLKKLWRWWERFSISKFSGIVVVTESIRRFFVDKAKESVLVSNMPSIENLNNFILPESKERQIIYVSGNNTPTRNVLQLIEAMPAVLKEFPNAELMFAGFYRPEGYKEVMQSKIKQLGIQKNVILDGALPWQDNFSRTAQASIGCVFWQKNENYANTIPNRLFEYMFCGIPVISDDTVELRRIIDTAKCGIYADSENPIDISKAIIGLLSNKQKADEYGENGRKAVFEKFNFNVELNGMIDFYNRILSKKHVVK